MRRVLGAALAALSLALLAGCTFCGVCWFREYRREAGRLQSIEEEFVVRTETFEDGRTAAAGPAGFLSRLLGREELPAAKEPEEEEHRAPVSVDWEGLEERVDRVVAWISIPGLSLSYPVVQGEDNDYYLHHNVDGEESGYGAIFLNYDSPPDFSDSNCIVFGHNMRDGSMFRRINDYCDPEGFRAAPYIYISTADGRTLCYRVFSAYQSPEGDPSFSYGIPLGSRDYARQQKLILARSAYETGTEISPGRPMLTLKTCNTLLDYGTRTSVSAILLWEEDSPAGS